MHPEFTNPELPPAERAKALLDAIDGRTSLKAWATWLEEQGDPALRQAIVREGRRRGAELPDEAVRWPSKRLLRRARARLGPAQERRNPLPRDEAFRCLHCQADVPSGGASPRNHCPVCLRSQHLDRVPGDRSAGCGALMDPVALRLRRGHSVIVHRCRGCGAEAVNRASTDGPRPDDPSALARLSAGESLP